MLHKVYALTGLGWLVVSLVAPLSAQTPALNASTPALMVRGVGDKPVTLQAADLGKLPHKTVKVRDQGGTEMTFEGVAVGEVMKRAGMDMEASLHGRALTKYLLVEAADKYRVVFSLPEFDPAFTDRLVLLATTKDGKPISPEEGPFRLVVPDDKRHARWVHQVRILSLIDAVPPADRNKKP